MKKIAKIVSIIVAVGLIVGVLFVANAFVGNPISKAIVSGNAKDYVLEKYPNTDYYVDSVGHNFKTGGYLAHIKSKSSKDTYFSVKYNSFGKVGYDNFESYVGDRFNTWRRIDGEYREKTDEVIENLDVDTDIAFGGLETSDKGNNMLDFGIDMKSLELDKDYDLGELGSKYGKITLYVYDNEVSVDKMAEVLLKVKEKFDEGNASFYAIDLVLRSHRNEDKKDWQDNEDIRVECFLYEDIKEDGLEEKVQEAVDRTSEYYEEKDKEKDIEKTL